MSCALRAPPRSPLSACFPKPRPDAVRRAGGRRSVAFGPRALSARLAELLPDFPQVSVCVAFSGGPDSTALLGALAATRAPPLELRAIHIDHRLHPHSRRWSAHCARVARALAVPLTVLSATVAPLPGESLEAAARTVRYRRLGEALRDGEAHRTPHRRGAASPRRARSRRCRPRGLRRQAVGEGAARAHPRAAPQRAALLDHGCRVPAASGKPARGDRRPGARGALRRPAPRQLAGSRGPARGRSAVALRLTRARRPPEP